MGIVFNEGFSVDACKALVAACRDKGIAVFVLHDTDPSGYVIYDHLRAMTTVSSTSLSRWKREGAGGKMPST